MCAWQFRSRVLATRILAHALAVLAIGCGGGETFKLAPVSGTVTLDGMPLPNAVVTFSPKVAKKGVVAGPSSTGITDENGHFVLTATTGEPGAVVGKHAVSIWRKAANQEDDAVDYEAEKKLRLPARYSTQSKLTFDVSADGANNTANFDLTSELDDLDQLE